MSLLELKNAGFSYAGSMEDPVFSGLSLSLEKGELLSILGPNGAGKTTVVRCLTGLLRLHEGAAYLNGRDIREISGRDLFRKVSYVPQARGNIPSITALENVLLGLSGGLNIFSGPSRADVEKAEKTMEFLGISALRDRLSDTLSGGELQMVLLARAMVCEPELLVLDEPESGLDFKNQLMVLHALRALSKEGVGVIFNTHYPEHALTWSDKALMLFGKGRQEALFGKTEEVVTETSIGRCFSVEAKIVSIDMDNETIKTVIPVRLLGSLNREKRGETK